MSEDKESLIIKKKQILHDSFLRSQGEKGIRENPLDVISHLEKRKKPCIFCNTMVLDELVHFETCPTTSEMFIDVDDVSEVDIEGMAQVITKANGMSSDEYRLKLIERSQKQMNDGLEQIKERTKTKTKTKKNVKKSRNTII